MTTSFRFIVAAIFSLLAVGSTLAATTKPLKVLLVTGGCCHDYVRQKDILKAGLEERANLVVDHMHTPDTSTRPPFASLKDANYAQGYDLVIHDECAAGIDDPELVRNVLQPHLDGIPAVALHCAMHSFRVVKDFNRPQAPGSAGALWFDFLGLQSSGHGPQEPIAISFANAKHPITIGMQDWTTIKEELYNNVQPPSVFPAHRSLASGRQTVKNKDGTTKDLEAVVIWTNEFGPKRARVFATTLGHNNATVEDARYLDLVARGILWATGKLGRDGKPKRGYGPAKQ